MMFSVLVFSLFRKSMASITVGAGSTSKYAYMNL